MSTLCLVFALMFAFLNVVDAHMTLYALDRGAIELNPLMRAVVKSKPLFLGIKYFVSASAVYLALKKPSKFLTISLAVATLAYTYVVWHNYK